MGQKTNKKKWKYALGVCLFCMAALVGALIFYERKMDTETMGCRISVNGLDVSKLTPTEAAAKAEQAFQDKKVIFLENGETVYETTLGEMGYSLKETSLEESLLEVKESRGTSRLFEEQKEYSINCEVIADEEKAAEVLSAANFSPENRTASSDAYVTYEEESQSFVLIEDVQGNQIDETLLARKTAQTLEENFRNDLFSGSVTVTIGTEVYQAAATVSDESMREKTDALNQKLANYRTASVTYLFGNTTETLDSATICSWLSIGSDSVSIQEEAAVSWLETLSAKYNTMYVPRYFQTSGGEQVVISGNEYGYWIDAEGELAQLLADIERGTAVEREPVYSQQGMNRNGTDDLVGSYIEVSLDQQHLWLYKDGVLITETDIVSGLPTEERETYRGAWPIAYKASPYTLSSDIYGYETDVTYWMPFVYGQGLHDANWRSSFGGDIYKTDGSHGCINLPTEQAEIIYNTIESGYPIIIY